MLIISLCFVWRCKLKWSNYNIYKEIENELLLYNTLSEAKIIISKELYDMKVIDIESTVVEKLKKMGFIVDASKNEFESVLPALKPLFEQTKTFYLFVQITDYCNLQCGYCFNSANANVDVEEIKLNINKFNEFIMNYKCYNVCSVIFTGGEPILKYNSIIKLQKILMSNFEKVNSTIITNATILTEKVVSDLLEFGIKNFQITLDGDAEIHNKIRNVNGNGTFDLIISRVKMINKITKTRILLRLNITIENYCSMRNLICNIEKYGLKHIIVLDICRVYGTEGYFTDLVDQFVKLCKLAKKLNLNVNCEWRDVIPISKNCNLFFEKNNFTYVYDSKVYKCTYLRNNFLANSNFIVSSKCEYCKFYPMCLGGCAFQSNECDYYMYQETFDLLFE